MAEFPLTRGSEDLTGHKYGRITVTGWSYCANGKRHWICECSCGNTKGVPTGDLKSGRTRSCGCLRKEMAQALGQGNCTHSATDSPEWRSWKSMHGRCKEANQEKAERYAHRGITVCERWYGEQGFVNFLEDMGKRPSLSHSIGRIDNDKGYCPENCRWETRTQQQNNTCCNVNVTAFGKTQTVAMWAREKGISKNTIYGRLYRGWDPERAVSEPPKKGVE